MNQHLYILCNTGMARTITIQHAYITMTSPLLVTIGMLNILSMHFRGKRLWS